MDIGIISSRYAKALLRFATEKGENKEVYRSMVLLGESFQQIPTLRDALENPVLSNEKKIDLLHLAAGGDICESLDQFFHLVLRNHRIAMVQFMTHSFIDSYRKQQHLIHSQLTVPVKIDSATIERLKSIVKEKTQNEVEFVVKEDPSIIGGFIMEYDTYCFDGSIKGKLNRIRKELLSNDKFMAIK
jgi:F-type H+-transporting ATPase subunit delta